MSATLIHSACSAWHVASKTGNQKVSYGLCLLTEPEAASLTAKSGGFGGRGWKTLSELLKVLHFTVVLKASVSFIIVHVELLSLCPLSPSSIQTERNTAGVFFSSGNSQSFSLFLALGKKNDTKKLVHPCKPSLSWSGLYKMHDMSSGFCSAGNMSISLRARNAFQALQPAGNSLFLCRVHRAAPDFSFLHSKKTADSLKAVFSSQMYIREFQKTQRANPFSVFIY